MKLLDLLRLAKAEGIRIRPGTDDLAKFLARRKLFMSAKHLGDRTPIVAIESKKTFLGYAETGDLKGVITALEKGVPLNSTDSNRNTALILSSMNGHFDVVEYLINLPGIDLEKRNIDEDDALTWAYRNQYLEIYNLISIKMLDLHEQRQKLESNKKEAYTQSK